MASEWEVIDVTKSPGAIASPGNITPYNPWEITEKRKTEPIDFGGVDYDLGAPFSVRMNLLRQSNAEEAKAYLDKTYGPGNYGQDENGQWWVTETVPAGFDEWKRASKQYKQRAKKDPLGDSYSVPEILDRDARMERDFRHGITPQAGERETRKVAVFPTGFGQELLPGMAASAPAQAGAIVGGVAGGAMAGPPGAIAGTALGAAGGKAWDEYQKYLEGTYRKTPGETAVEIGTEAGLQGAMAAAPYAKNLVTGPGKAILRKIGGVTPESRAMGQKLLEEHWIDPGTGVVQKGVIPPWGSVATKSKALEYDRFVRNLLTGDPKDPERTRYMLSRIKRFLSEDLQLPPAEIERTMKEVVDKSASISSQTTTESLERWTQEHVGRLRASIDSNTALARNELRGSESALRQFADQPVGDVSTNVANAINRARSEFGRRMDVVYEDIHAIDPRPLVDRDLVHATARNIESELAAQQLGVPGDVARLARETEDMQPWTIQEAHRLRNELRRLADNLYNPLTPNTAWRRVQDLATAVDQSLNAIEGRVGDEVRTALRSADDAYRTGMTRFSDAKVQQLVSMTRRQLPPDPETMVSSIFQPGYTRVAQEVWRMLPPATRMEVQQVQIRNLLNDATAIGPEGRRVLDGKLFADMLADPQQRRLLEITTPRARIAEMETLGRELAALDSKIDPAALPPSRAVDALREAAVQARQLDEFAKSSPLKSLVSANPDERGRAAAYVIEPGEKTEQRTIDTFNLLGHDSPQVLEIRRYAMRKLLNSVVEETPSRQKRVVGKAIEEQLSAYTPRQQELLFPGQIDYLKELARDARFLFPFAVGSEGKEIGQSLGAASIQSGLPRVGAIKRFAWKYLAGWLSDNPKVIGMMVDLQKQDPTAAAEMRKWMYRWALDASVTQGPGTERPPEPEKRSALGGQRFAQAGRSMYDVAPIPYQESPPPRGRVTRVPAGEENVRPGSDEDPVTDDEIARYERKYGRPHLDPTAIGNRRFQYNLEEDEVEEPYTPAYPRR